MKYSIATNWEDMLTENLLELNKNTHDNEIYQLFASKAFSILGSANTNVPDLSGLQISEKISDIRNKGLKFNYLINSSRIPNIEDAKIKLKVLEYLSWVDSLDIDILTVANEDLLKLILNNFPHIPINISIVNGIKSIQKSNDLREKYPNIVRLTLHQDINRDNNLLKQHVDNAHNHHKLMPVEIELLANEICFLGCKVMKKHYDALTSISQMQGDGKDFMFGWCCAKRKRNIMDFINSSFIRPEDIYLYEEMGVDIIKLAGRKEPTSNLILRAKAYMEEKYRGNIMDLFLSEFWPENKPPFIENSHLNGFLEYLWKNNIFRFESTEELKKFRDLEYNWK